MHGRLPRWPLSKHTILFLAANPFGTDRLALDQEARAIQVALERSGHRDHFELVTRWAVQPLDLLDELRKLKPTVVHFSGHGGHGKPGKVQLEEGSRHDIECEAICVEADYEHGLFFQGPDGRAQLVSTAALAETFDAAGSSVRLVVLNACYSDMQADTLLAHVDYVVGVRGTIGDDAARNFAIGLYGGLGERESVTQAYKQGCAAISLEGLPDAERPRLMFRVGIDAHGLVLTDTRPALDAATAPPPRRWTRCSSLASADAGLVSTLAIAETIAATGVYAWIAWQYGTLHLTISACIAPFLLLRTPYSISMALDGYTTQHRRWRHETTAPIAAWDATLRSESFVSVFSALWQIFDSGNWVSIEASIIIHRCATTIISMLKHPLASVTRVPRNWWYFVACIDSCHPVEALPGAYLRRRQKGHELTNYDEFLMPGRAIRGSRALRSWGLLSYLYLAMFAVVAMLPALAYRWSLKGVALLYSPLIWIVHSSTARSLRDHLHDIHELALHRIARWFATFTLLLFAAKFYLYCTWNELASSWHSIPGHRLLDAVVLPEAFPPWQLASATNAALTWTLYFAADGAVRRWKRGSPVNEDIVEVGLRWLSLLRGILSVYTIVCGIYLAASLSGKFNLPPMGTRILPWM